MEALKIAPEARKSVTISKKSPLWQRFWPHNQPLLFRAAPTQIFGDIPFEFSLFFPTVLSTLKTIESRSQNCLNSIDIRSIFGQHRPARHQNRNPYTRTTLRVFCMHNNNQAILGCRRKPSGLPIRSLPSLPNISRGLINFINAQLVVVWDPVPQQKRRFGFMNKTTVFESKNFVTVAFYHHIWTHAHSKN